MFAELVCLETTPAKWHGGALIFRGLAYFRGETGHVQNGRMTGYCTGFHGVDYRGFDGRLVTAAETGDAAADGSAIRRVRTCGERSIAPFPNRRGILLPSHDPQPGF